MKIDDLNKDLKPLDDNNELPEELQPSNIEKKLKQSEMKPKKNKIFTLKRSISAVAALLILAVGISVIPGLVKPKVKNTQTDEYFEIAKNYSDIENFFVKLQKTNDLDIMRLYGGSKSADGFVTAVTDESFSNNTTQVEGVDEDYLFKNDGEFFYIADQDEYLIKIVNISSPDNMNEASCIKFNESTFFAGLYYYEDKLVVITSDFEQAEKTKVYVYDIKDRENPELLNTFSQDGDYLTTRLIDNQLYVLSNYYVYNLSDEDVIRENCIPTYSYSNNDKKRVPLERIIICPENESPEYLIIGSIDLDNCEKSQKIKAILGGSSEAYCTTDTLYAARERNDKTDIFRFNLENGEIVLNGIGQVPGYFLNQFSMDEYGDYFRVATSYADTDKGSNIFVLNKKLKIVSSITGIEKGETIKAVNFMGERGYIVTFVQTDPLFVINLEDPLKPYIEGELKIPGFSSYLHSLDEKSIVGIGYFGDDSGLIEGLKISLFDISDPKNPVEKDVFCDIESYSSAQETHKAFYYNKEKGLFGIPITSYKSNSFGLFAVENEKLVLKTKVTLDIGKNKYSYDVYGASVGNVFYAVYTNQIKAISLSTFTELGSVNL